jgi:hypothetical protein
VILLPNVYVWTGRPAFDHVSLSVSPPVAYLASVPGRMTLPTAKEMTYVPASLVGAVDWVLCVDVDIDILEGVTELDGVTTYPRNMSGSTRYAWQIRYVDTTPPLLLPERRVYLALLRDGM